MPTLALGSRSIARICRRIALILALMYSTEEHPGLLVIGGEGGIDDVFRLGCGVECDHDDALLPGRLDSAENPASAARSDEDATHALPHQILDRGEGLLLSPSNLPARAITSAP